MDRAKARFVTGGSPQSDIQQIPYGGKLAGETRFTFRYEYNCHLKWFQSRRASEEPQVRIRVRFRKLKFIISHDIWLRQPPPPDRFWTDPVVRHEMDHVRISSDQRVERQFLDQANKISSFEVPLSTVADARGLVKEPAIRAAVDQQLQAVLRNATEYVDIRYRELDRLTRHGLRALPPKSQLFTEPESKSDR